MGTIRTLLAISVILAHAGPIAGTRLIGGHAVQAFFIISGFYMSLILGDKYSLDRRGIVRFYLSRYVRLMPTYLLVLASAVGVAMWLGYTNFLRNDSYLAVLGAIGVLPAAWIVFSNTFLFGLDGTLFFNVQNNGALTFAESFEGEGLPLHRLQLVPQAWSLGVELGFYLLAPFLVPRSTRTLIALAAASIALRIGIYSHGWENEPWSDRFFPTEMIYFITGILCHRFYKSKTFAKVSHWSAAGIILPLLMLITFQWIDIGDTEVQRQFLFAGFAICIPFAFHFSRASAWDRKIGELSYPIYLIHVLVLQVVAMLYPQLRDFQGVIVTALTLVLAVATYYFVDRHVERLRHKLFHSKSANEKNKSFLAKAG